LGEAIDHPVKTYSSGMYVRLGFAVATGFDPDILIIDEALSVGDQYFQKKSTDRIVDFKKQGKTILFCSHNLYQVRALCDRAMWLERGREKRVGDATDVVDAYRDTLREEAQKSEPADRRLQEKPLCWIESARLCSSDPTRPVRIQPGDTLALEVWARFEPEFDSVPGIAVGIVRNDGVVVYTVASTMESVPLLKLDGNRYYARIVYPNLQLLPGHYYFNVGTTDEENLQGYDIRERVEPFIVTSKGLDFGIVRLEHRWENY
ncbi:MAG TPA: Wzt carbohydrate-binding domain-containing protein, partial [Acidobacteriota bacterium]|nr:Wzt carbohydrate-binding domain-containing protein [Acidobacteriota bacterium]